MIESEKALELASVQRVCLGDGTVVLAEKVHRAQDGAVGALAAQRGDGLKELLLVHLAQHLLAKIRRYLLHLARHGDIIIGQITVTALGVGDAEVVAGFGKVEAVLLHHRLLRVSEIEEHKAADGADHLVKQTAALAEIDVLSILTDLGDLDLACLAVVILYVDDRADQRFKGGGG